MDLEARDIEAVAVKIGWQVCGLREPGALPVLVRGGCRRLAGDDEDLPVSRGGVVVAGFAASAAFAVSWVRYNLSCGDVLSITRTRALLWRHPFPFRVAFTADEPVWLVHVDPTLDVIGDRRSEAHLRAPYARFDDPAADQPILGPGGSARLLRTEAPVDYTAIEAKLAGKERRLARHRYNTVDLGIPEDYEIPTVAPYEAPWVPKVS